MSDSNDPAKPPNEQSADQKTPGSDVQLSQMLQDALQDFGRPAQPSGYVSGESTVPDPDIDDLPPFFTQDMAQKAAADFQNMLKQLAAVQEAAIKSNTAPTPAMVAVPNIVPDAGDADLIAAAATASAGTDPAMAFLENLQKLTAKAGEVASATTEEDFMRTMNSFNDSGMQNDLMPFMHELMTSLMSKEMMYPSLKEMVEKVCYAGFVCCGGTHGVVQYPQWLNDNGERVSQDERKLYETQLTIMRQLVAEYESERADDSDDVRAKRFDTIMVLMQKMQLCGHPPKELVGDLPPGWGFDATSGMPAVVDTEAAAQNGCTLM